MSSPKFIRLVLNGKSSANEEVRSAVGKLRELGHRVDVRVTWEFGDAARYAKEAALDGADVVVAGGGDGSVNEVTAGLMSLEDPRTIDVAILPLGTANDFATGCQIPTQDPLAALRLAAEGESATIDIGRCNDHYFVNVASGGFGAEVTTNTPPELKKAIGGAAYALTGLVTAAKMTSRRCELSLPNGETHRGNVFVMEVGNGRQCGGGQQVTPHALLDDGLLDLMLVHNVDLMSFGNLVNEWVTLGDPANQNISYAQLASFKIECDEPLQVNLDGEPISERVFEFRAVPGAIRLILPPNAPPLHN